MEEAKTQLVPDAIFLTRLARPGQRMETIAGHLIPLPVARPKRQNRRAILELACELDQICEKATRGPEVTGTFDAPELPRGNVLATLEPWPLPSHPPEAPAPIAAIAPSAALTRARASRFEVALLYGSVSLATFLSTVAALY